MNNRPKTIQYPLPIARWMDTADKACEANGADCHRAAQGLSDALTYYIGALAVASYTQALFTEQIEADPTLNRSLRSLRRILPGQWLLWAGRGLSAVPAGPVEGLREWYLGEQSGEIAAAYEALRATMTEHLAYTGEYGRRESVSPRLLLEMVDQYRIRRGKAGEVALPRGVEQQTASALVMGLRAAVAGAPFLPQYQLYAPQERRLLMGPKPTTPMPPITTPGDLAGAATLLLYPPGEAPDYTKRPDLQSERMPLFPLDPLLAYIRCPECDRHRVAALQEVTSEVPTYRGSDPDCGHAIRPFTTGA